MDHALAVVEPWIAAYGVGALFVTIFLESFGAPLPSEGAILVASVLALRGDISIVYVTSAAWCGAVLGDTTGYFIGRLGGRPLLMRFGPHLGLTKARLESLSARVQRHSFTVVLFARFIWLLRQLNGVLAGSLSMPLVRFVPANMIGAALWVGLWAIGPYFFAAQFGVSAIQKL